MPLCPLRAAARGGGLTRLPVFCWDLCLLSRCAFKTRITLGVANPSPPPSLPELSKQSALVGLCGNRQAPITAPSLGELPRNVDEIRELKGADFSSPFGCWDRIPSARLRDCHGCLFPRARASSALGRVQCHGHSEAEKNVELPFPYQNSSSHAPR